MMRRDFKKLGEKVDGLAETLVGVLDHRKLKNSPAPGWHDLNQEQEAAQLAALREWVDGVLLAQYPEYTFPGCWAAHRAALWELGSRRAGLRRRPGKAAVACRRETLTPFSEIGGKLGISGGGG